MLLHSVGAPAEFCSDMSSVYVVHPCYLFLQQSDCLLARYWSRVVAPEPMLCFGPRVMGFGASGLGFRAQGLPRKPVAHDFSLRSPISYPFGLK